MKAVGSYFKSDPATDKAKTSNKKPFTIATSQNNKAAVTVMVQLPKIRNFKKMSYPLSFRKKVLSDWESGTSVKDLIHRYRISTSTLYSWKVSLEPKKHWNQSPRKITDESLLDDIKLHPDAYQHERAARLNCSQSGIYKALKRLNITRKKRPETS